MSRSLLAIGFALLVPAPAFAHGGTYRPPTYNGPGDGFSAPRAAPAAAPPRRTAPTSPGGSAPTPTNPLSPRRPHPLLDPMSGGVDEIPVDITRWESWWGYNHDAYLDVRRQLAAFAASSDDNWIETERRALQQAVASAFETVIQKGERTTVLRQMIVTLARLADEDGIDVVLAPFTEQHLRGAFPELQESAVLAAGLTGDFDAIGLLRDVLMDNEEGRKATGSQGAIAIRLRSFAAYALGMLGQRVDSELVRRYVVHALLYALGEDSSVEREIRVACVLALGLVPAEPCRTPEEALDPARQIEEFHLCGGVVLEYLVALARERRADPWVRGHAAAALGRLTRAAGEGLAETEDHPAVLSRDQVVRALVDMLDDADGVIELEQGAALGLGLAADADSDAVDRAARKKLVERIRRGEPMTQRFALVALGAVVGRPGDGDKDEGWGENLPFFLRELARSRSGKLPWTALALGVAGHGRLAHARAVPEEIALAIRSRLASEKDPVEAGGLALGLAVLRAEDARTKEALIKAFERIDDASFRTYAAIGLGFLGVHDAADALRASIAAEDASLEVVLAASVGLRLLGHRDVVGELVRRLKESKEPADEIAIVHTLAFLQDPSAGMPLLDLLADPKRDADVRASMAWCLGTLADSTAPDWTAVYANDLDYNHMTWTLSSPLGDGLGLLDWR